MVLIKMFDKKESNIEFNNKVFIFQQKIDDFYKSYLLNLPKSVLFSCLVISIYLLIAIFYDFLPIRPYNEQSYDILVSPCRAHLLGTDDLGMDILSQLLYGTRISVIIGLSCTTISVFIGGILGTISAYFGGVVDKIILSLFDVFNALPNLPLMIVLGAFLGPSLLNVVIAICIVSWVYPARMVRSKVLHIKNQPFLKLSRKYGGKFPYIFYRHLLPSLYPVFLTGFIKIINRAIIAEASLAFLGLSDPTSKSWGMVLNSVLQFEHIFLTEFWKWWLISPIAFLLIFVLNIANVGKYFELKI